MVYATAVRLLGDPADAEDAAQTVFLKAFEHFDDVRESQAAGGWLKTTTRNVCLNHLARYRSRRRLFSEIDRREDGEDGYEGSIASGDVPIDLAFDLAAAREALQPAVRALPDHPRGPLVPFLFEETTYEEIARTLGVSLGKVKTDIHRGRQALRRLLTP